MPKIDLKKEFASLYTASKKVERVRIPALNFLMIDGQGDPAQAPEYQAAVEALYGLSYALKFDIKRSALGVDYGVMPLEGLWYVDDLSQLAQRDQWRWTMMIMQPQWVTAARVKKTIAALGEKKKIPALPLVRFEKFTEGPAAQVLHVGPYSAEWPTIDRLHAFIRDNGYTLVGKHHEIYLGDPRRTASEKLKTILRQPVARIARAAK